MPMSVLSLEGQALSFCVYETSGSLQGSVTCELCVRIYGKSTSSCWKFHSLIIFQLIFPVVKFFPEQKMLQLNNVASSPFNSKPLYCGEC
jgi:hypothetical protein